MLTPSSLHAGISMSKCEASPALEHRNIHGIVSPLPLGSLAVGHDREVVMVCQQTASRRGLLQSQMAELPPHGAPLTRLLELGDTVQIGEHYVSVERRIGEGTFGAVWSARSSTGSRVAIKEIRCLSESAVATAHYEGQILKALAAASADADDEAVERIPVLVASSTECLGNEEWSVRLAMTQIPGESLNRFIERHRTESDTLRPQPTPYEQLKTACFFTRELLSQLAPAFARISSLAYHRDVNPRNILIDDADRTQPRYGLIDFGLAVEATQWRLGTVEKAGEAVVGVWQVWGVGGDCRYWPVSSWLMLEQGPRALSSCPHLCMEYKTHLDLHALGVTALQVFMDLSPSPAHQEPTQEILEKLWTLHHAWERYWDDATCFWKRLFNAYRSGDNSDLSAVKAEYRRLAVHRQVGQSLSNLRVALAAVAEACEPCHLKMI
jgi:hypothetical protein